MNILLIFCAAVLAGFLSITILWVLYLAVMCLVTPYQAGKIPAFAVRAGRGLYAVGLLWDVKCNLIWTTLIFLEFPRELTVSARLRRLVTGADGWRKRLAIWFASTLLNPFSPGGPHIPLQ